MGTEKVESPQSSTILVAVVVRALGLEGGGFTVTVKVQGVAELPAASVALHVTTVLPMGNELPEAGLHTAVSGLQLSVTPAAGYMTVALIMPAAAVTVCGGGQVTIGAVLSSMLTLPGFIKIDPFGMMPPVLATSIGKPGTVPKFTAVKLSGSGL